MKFIFTTFILFVALNSQAQSLEVVANELNRLSQGSNNQAITYDLKDSDGYSLNAQFIIIKSSSEQFNIGVKYKDDFIRNNVFIRDILVKDHEDGTILITNGNSALPGQNIMKLKLFFNKSGLLVWVKATMSKVPRISILLSSKMYL